MKMNVRVPDSSSGVFATNAVEQLERSNPADTAQTLYSIPSSTAADVDDAVRASQEALNAWSAMSTLDKSRVLRKVSDVLLDHAEPLAQMMSLELGKPITDAIGEVRNAATVFEYYSSVVMCHSGRVARTLTTDDTVLALRAPLGVVAAITPWNFPVNIAAVKIASATAFGNAVVWKPSPLASATSLETHRLLAEAGLPVGLVTLVFGDGAVVGEALIVHPDVAAVSFTGSTEVGRRILALAALHNTRAQCEMGGKNAIVVLRDADIPRAVASVVDSGFRLAGQRCTAASRVVVDEPIYQTFVAELLAATRNVILGDPAAPGTLIGPLVSEQRLSVCAELVAAAQASGGTVLCGGRSVPDATGHFYEPTLIEIGADSVIAQTEVFGPVISIHAVNGLDEALAVVNSTTYGLSAAIHTASMTSAQRFIEQAQVGAVAVNGTTAGWPVHMSFGGWKNSGTGFPELGPESEHFYSKLKTVRIESASH